MFPFDTINTIVFPADSVNQAYPPSDETSRLNRYKGEAFFKIPTKLDDGQEGKIACLWIPQRNSRNVLLYSHGNAENLHPLSFDFYRELSDATGASLIVYDYSGYGRSSGRASEQNCQNNILAVYEWLTTERIKSVTNREPYQWSDVILVGRSVGSGPTVWLGSTKRVKKMVLISPFKSTTQVIAPFSIPFFDYFPSYRRIRELDFPILFIHGREDEVVPFTHGEWLYTNSRTASRLPAPNNPVVAPLWLEHRGHNDIFVESTVVQRIGRFVNTDIQWS
ncbi:alpha/beta-hydrolase [Gonapodya prolifera JEL478]|uniref:Alpha/beta-hydrolase n=1 Tax=Gonapodya prolifera (strain JEL478) TaxID=1344416 RepID=A0A139AXG4_GONPJ|nr:alpha/beta-hydrolase [Gonapodya prolifera JEL478]|eukprot:KXS21145.1 alpha/beta-hydrolase [Gonapodya prolifera JEL478]